MMFELGNRDLQQIEMYKQRTVGDLVVENPSLAKVFQGYKIDFCCGGKIPLADACRQKNIDCDTVVQQLISHATPVGAKEEDWSIQPLTNLIEHIIETYHKPLQAELPNLEKLAEKVARVHGETHPEMVKVAAIMTRLRDELELHMQKEEMVLFPAVANIGQPNRAAFGCGRNIEMPIKVMTLEHEDAGQALEQLRKLTNDYTPPVDACNSFRVLLFSLAKLESEMHLHVHKENHILFPRALQLQANAPI